MVRVKMQRDISIYIYILWELARCGWFIAVVALVWTLDTYSEYDEYTIERILERLARIDKSLKI